MNRLGLPRGWGFSAGVGAGRFGFMINEAALSRQYALLRPSLDERGRRLFAATQAQALGYGGIAAVARATRLAPSTIGRGLKEIADGVPPTAAPPGWRAQAADGQGCDVGARLVGTDRADDAGLPGASAAVGVQEPGEAGGGVAAERPPGVGEPGAPAGLFPPGKLQGQR